MKYPKLRELKEAVRSLVSRPYTTKFPYRPHEPMEKFRGKPEFYEKDCTGCCACAQVCPAGAIEFEDDIKDKQNPKRRLTLRHDTCIFCGQCQLACITEKGVMLTREYDLATFDRKEIVATVEKDLVLCQECGAVIAPLDHLKWIAKKVGPSAFANPSLFLAHLKGLNLAEEDLPAVVAQVFRADRLKVLCTKCRRRTTLERY